MIFRELALVIFTLKKVQDMIIYFVRFLNFIWDFNHHQNTVRQETPTLKETPILSMSVGRRVV